MKAFRLIAAAAAAILLCATASAQQGKIEKGSIESAILGVTVDYNVYLPYGYNEAEHYPIIYLLHGLGDTYTAWDKKGNVKFAADRMIRSGEMVKTVIIMPNAGGPDSNVTWNGYFNMPGWSYEDFFFQELIPTVEKKYNAGGSKGQRAVMGLSMGGGGSTVYSQRHPDMFCCCFAMSAWLTNKEGQVRGGDTRTRMQHLNAAVNEHDAIDFVRNADKATLDALRSVKWFIDCGDDDFIFDGSIDLYRAMRRQGVKAELRVRDGVHNWEYWHESLSAALPYASRNFCR